MALTVRGRTMRWHTQHRFLTEQPPGSNTDQRTDGIRHAQIQLGAWLVGLAWCGVWAAAGLIAGTVKGVSYRLASVLLIEQDARDGRAPFRDWLAPTLANARRCLRGDLVVLFGAGVHVGTFRALKYVLGVGWCVRTEEGNTSSGIAGSQSDGGMSTPRLRPLADVHGLARVDFPGGRPARSIARATALAATLIPARASDVTRGPAPASSDRRLLAELQAANLPDPAARDLLAELTAALH